MKYKSGDMFLDPIVMDAFDFNADDMYINQQGDISDYQLGCLKNSRLTNTAIWLGLMFIPILFGVFFMQKYQGFSSQPGMTVWMMVGLVCLILLIAARNIWNRYTDDMYHNQVEEISYTIDMDIENEGKSGISYTLYIVDLRFKLNKKQFLALKNRELYTLFYTPSTKKLLSIAQVI